MSPRSRLALRRAVALGALHGPAELLPISSSGHVAVFPWLLGWEDDGLDDELRKAFEVALHAGTAAALLITLRDEVLEAGRGLDRRRLMLIALSLAPPAVAGLALERPIEERLGTPGSVAAGLLAGSVAMALADRRPQLRRHEQAGAFDGLWLGIAQACALIPGVSRNGATLAAARFRGFTRPDANRLSRHAALPVIAGATALKGVRLWQRGVEPEARRALAAGAVASFASTLVSTWLIGQVERDRSLMPYVLYRSGLAGMICARLRHGRFPR
ncbi:MAG TPA: undecaprenyl-diphosphate phosphatase [Solirubrobacteraceae bacterium]|jgi:undecaprenyl-diphosphatase